MNRDSASSPAIWLALLAALLFGASTPVVKHLIGDAGPWLTAGLLYFGSGVGLALFRCFRDGQWVQPHLTQREWLWYVLSILFGGILAPLLLVYGLRYISGGSAALLLNLEAVFTALIAWYVFHEHTNRRVIVGMVAIVAGSIVLSWPADSHVAGNWLGSLCVAAACLGWACDNNFTRKVSATDATFIAGVKGLIAGTVNIALGMLAGSRWPEWSNALSLLSVGLLAYGVSLVLFVLSLRQLGSARTGAYFSVAPFAGALVAIAWFAEPLSLTFMIAAGFMIIGVYLHVTERHSHWHAHDKMQHTHRHVHDEHHRHEHNFDWDGDEPHSHPHAHEPMSHEHAHFPDIHHQHKH